jgi:hypothetical protein
MKQIKIGLDIDGVLADFHMHWHMLYPEINPRPKVWEFDENIGRRFNDMKERGVLDDFYLNIPILTKPEDIPFEPDCYITSRPVSSKISEAWLYENGFPKKKVITVEVNTSKVITAKKQGIDIFIDDKYENFLELNDAGIKTFLFTASWNKKFDVGDLRINSLKELHIFNNNCIYEKP